MNDKKLDRSKNCDVAVATKQLDEDISPWHSRKRMSWLNQKEMLQRCMPALWIKLSRQFRSTLLIGSSTNENRVSISAATYHVLNRLQTTIDISAKVSLIFDTIKIISGMYPYSKFCGGKNLAES